MNDKKVNVFCFDVDNTIVDGYTQKYFLNFLFHIGKVNIFFLILSYAWFIFYKLNMTKNLYLPMSMVVKKLKGIEIREFNKLFDLFFDEYLKKRIFLGMRDGVIKGINKDGNVLVLLSTSFAPIVERVAKSLGVSHFIGTQIGLDGGFCTGHINGVIIDGMEKVNAMDNFLTELNLDRLDVNLYFYTDSHNDMELLMKADHQVVINPSKKLRNIAIKNNWPIIKY
jgi:HAD superfamily hydrolase (TIGR01490 family)